jgi:predicted nucleic acid-binding protein
VPEAVRVLTEAVASRNGSTSDAYLLACAWLLDADIWSHDRDFAGTGWPSWSNANLLRALGDA